MHKIRITDETNRMLEELIPSVYGGYADPDGTKTFLVECIVQIYIEKMALSRFKQNLLTNGIRTINDLSD